MPLTPKIGIFSVLEHAGRDGTGDGRGAGGGAGACDAGRNRNTSGVVRGFMFLAALPQILLLGQLRKCRSHVGGYLRIEITLYCVLTLPVLRTAALLPGPSSQMIKPCWRVYAH